ncbi:hypothetical protein A5698_16425 [Mycobacterium sp. E136]|uniref:hypothetical protein n=1 Tax=Mycobacterium sp. E136 TaxID=1834125 RepID=UPI0007FC441C|nr:hypothetical protein [Mycobacterium sp. E136]OBG94840.1 hypothetical protein A5698_16425 [Mycobacterium sp. E136]
MKASAKKCMTAGVALVGAGVIAAGPVAPAPANIADDSRSYEVALTAAAQKTEIDSQIEATRTLLEDLASGGLLEDFIKGTLEAYNRSGADAVNNPRPVTGLDAVGRIGQGVAASGLRLGATALAPLRLIELAQAISDGKGEEGFRALVTNIVDAPLWVVDPALFALRDALPAPLGGKDGLVMAIRDQLYRLTAEINDGLADPGAMVQRFVDGTIEAFEAKGPVEYVAVKGPIDAFSRVTQGTIASALRLAAAAVLGPVGVIQVAAAVAQGNTEDALKAVENIVDGPLWVADPVLYGLRDALPAPLGGPKNLVENFRNGLWSATERVNGAIHDAVEGSAPEATIQRQDNSGTTVTPLKVEKVEQVEKKAEINDSDLKLDSEQPKTTQQIKRPLGGLLSKPLSKLRPPSINVIKNSLNFSPGAKTNEKGPKGNAERADGTTPESSGGVGTSSAGTSGTGATGTGPSGTEGTGTGN